MHVSPCFRHTIGSLDADRRIVIRTMCCGYSGYSTDQCHLSLCGKKKSAAATAVAHSFHGNPSEPILVSMVTSGWHPQRLRERVMRRRRRDEVKKEERNGTNRWIDEEK